MLQVDKVIHHGGETGGVGHLRGRPCQAINLRAKKGNKDANGTGQKQTQKKRRKNQTLLACWTLMRNDGHVRFATACTGEIQLDQDAPQAPHRLSEL